MKIPEWALNEWVTVTAVTPIMALIQRVSPGTRPERAITVEGTETGELLVNGIDVMPIESDERIEHLCGVTDSVLTGMPVMGRTVKINARTAGR